MTLAYPVSERLDARRARFGQTLRTVAALAEAGVPVDLLIGRTPDLAAVLRAWDVSLGSDIRIRQLPILRSDGVSWNAVYHVACLVALARLARAGRLQAVYVRHLKLADALLRRQRLFRRPVVYEAHELHALTAPRAEARARMERLERRVFARASGVVAITAGVAEAIRERFAPASPITVAADGVDLSRFDARAWRGGRTIVYVGQLYPWKGVDVLVRALALLPGERARVVGGGDGVERLRALAREQGCADRVEFTGQVPAARVPELLSDAGVAVLPGTQAWIASRFTSPLKLFEYMAAGVPVVAGDVPALREVLTDGESALLVPAEDPEALAAGIRRVLDDPRLARRLRETARGVVAAYGWDARARRVRAAVDAAVARFASTST